MSNSSFLLVNPVQLLLINVLIDLKIASIRTLIDTCSYHYGHSRFCKVMVELEKKCIVKSFKDPNSGQKYIILTELGRKILNQDVTDISHLENRWFRYALLSNLVTELLKFRLFENAIIKIAKPHQLHEPDAILYGRKKNKPITIGIELHLMQGNIEDLPMEVQYGHRRAGYLFVFYFFIIDRVLENYKRQLQTYFGDKVFNEVILCFSPDLSSRNFSINNTTCFQQGKMKPLKNFLADNMVPSTLVQWVENKVPRCPH